jgi:hypothetical protein
LPQFGQSIERLVNEAFCLLLYYQSMNTLASKAFWKMCRGLPYELHQMLLHTEAQNKEKLTKFEHQICQ